MEQPTPPSDKGKELFIIHFYERYTQVQSLTNPMQYNPRAFMLAAAVSQEYWEHWATISQLSDVEVSLWNERAIQHTKQGDSLPVLKAMREVLANRVERKSDNERDVM